MSDPVKCEAQGCNNEAVGAIIVRRPDRTRGTAKDDVSITIHSEIAAAPKKAARLCRTHVIVMTGQLVVPLMYEDKAMS